MSSLPVLLSIADPDEEHEEGKEEDETDHCYESREMGTRESTISKQDGLDVRARDVPQ